ncbi:three-helix bundle dimerization domain-containing protein [Mycolicibacterium frederiksbergense]
MTMSGITEQSALAEITRRLTEELPGATPTEVEAAVAGACARFATSPIRDFIPLFVEKHARRTLSQLLLVSSG